MEKTVTDKTQSVLSRIFPADTTLRFEAVSGWGDGQQSSPRGEGWPAKPSQPESRAEFHFQRGIMVQDRKPRQTLGPRLNKHRGVVGQDYNLMHREGRESLHGLQEG